MLCGVIGLFHDAWGDIALRKVGHRVVPRFEEQKNLLAIGDPGAAEVYAHPSSQRLGIQQSLGQRFGHEKPADCPR
jgi:hypothetical protein